MPMYLRIKKEDLEPQTLDAKGKRAQEKAKEGDGKRSEKRALPMRAGTENTFRIIPPMKTLRLGNGE